MKVFSGPVALTGASGMVGREILAQCQKAKIPVFASSRRKPPLSPKGFKWRYHDLEVWHSYKQLDQLYGNAGALIHAGTAIPGHGDIPDTEQLMRTNVQSCLNLGHWAFGRGIPVVFFSSASVYAQPWRRGIIETDRCGPNSISGHYGLTKRLAETVLAGLAEQGLQLIVLRPSSIYGPGIPTQKLIPRFLRSFADGGTVELQPPLNDRHNLISAYDVARGCLKALASSARGVFNIAAPSSVSVREIALACHRTVGSGNIIEIQTGSDRRAVSRFDLDTTKAARTFGFTADYGLLAGLRLLYEYGF